MRRNDNGVFQQGLLGLLIALVVIVLYFLAWPVPVEPVAGGKTSLRSRWDSRLEGVPHSPVDVTGESPWLFEGFQSVSL